MAPPIALITGASSGIGKELAGVFAREGYSLIVVARDHKRLESLAAELHAAYATSVKVVPSDLSQSGAADRIWAALSPAEQALDVLVNCAGLGTFGEFWQSDLAKELAVLQVNMVASTHLTRLALPQMVRRGSGHILNIGSVAGFQPGPYMPTYYATKAYLLSYSEALSEQLRGSGVCVTLVAPGAVVTDFANRTGGGTVAPPGAGALSRLAYAMTNMQPQPVAEQAYRAMRQGKRLVIPGLINKAVPFLAHLLPRKALTRAVGRSQRYMR